MPRSIARPWQHRTTLIVPAWRAPPAWSVCASACLQRRYRAPQMGDGRFRDQNVQLTTTSPYPRTEIVHPSSTVVAAAAAVAALALTTPPRAYHALNSTAPPLLVDAPQSAPSLPAPAGRAHPRRIPLRLCLAPESSRTRVCECTRYEGPYARPFNRRSSSGFELTPQNATTAEPWRVR